MANYHTVKVIRRGDLYDIIEDKEAETFSKWSSGELTEAEAKLLQGMLTDIRKKLRGAESEITF